MAPRPRHALLVCLLAAATALAAWSGLLRGLRSVADLVLDPLQRGLAHGTDSAQRSPVAALTEQVIQLSGENVMLRTRLNDYQEIRGEGGVDPAQSVVVRARILARTIRSGRRYCELDAGAVDGVAVGMAACAGWSLAGVVCGLQEARCLVQEVSDSESRIPALLSDGKQLLGEGVLSGTGRRGVQMLDYIEDRSGLSILPGMSVITSGSDGRLPAGLVLGQVSAAERSATADHWRIEVTPVREAEEVESLLIIRFAAAAPGHGSGAPP